MGNSRKSNSKAVSDFRRRVKEALVTACGGRCGICKNKYPQYTFDLHHINPEEKSFGLSYNGLTNSLEKVVSEAKKCILLCSNCHRHVEWSGESFNFETNFSEEVFYSTIDVLNGNKAFREKRIAKELEQKERINRVKEEKDIFWKENRPSREELKSLIRNKPFLQIGKLYGVSDNAIRKWCLKHSLPNKVSEIKKISDEDWNKI